LAAWVTFEDTKRGTKSRYIDQRATAKTKAVEYLTAAQTAGELAGRTIARVAMAMYADENAIANSNRAFHQVTIEHSMPWADKVMEFIDELAGEKLPAALIKAVLKPRRAQHTERRAALAAQATPASASPNSNRASTSSARTNSPSSGSPAASRGRRAHDARVRAT
jgi:hypothetical protein